MSSEVSQFLPQFLLRGQSQLVLGSKYLIVQASQDVSGKKIIFPCAKNQTDGIIFIRLFFILPVVIQIKIHLSGVGMVEFPSFQVDENKTPKQAVIENQVDIIMAIGDGYPLLAGHERKSLPNSSRND